jgi:hypothetical protein
MAYKMKGSPLLKDVKMYEGSGNQIMVDDANLGEEYMDENGNKTRDYTYTTKDGKKGTDVLYLNKPRSGGSRKGDPVVPSDRPIDEEQFFA